MTEKEPVTLAVHLDLTRRTWSVASVNVEFEVVPLVQSQPDDLAPWSEGTVDEQVSFLRHRIAGVLQRGADRLWGRQQKARLFAIAFLCEDNKAANDIVDSVAQHFCTWMLKPPVVCLRFQDDNVVQQIAANTSCHDLDDLAGALRQIHTLMGQPDLWDFAPSRSDR